MTFVESVMVGLAIGVLIIGPLVLFWSLIYAALFDKKKLDGG